MPLPTSRPGLPLLAVLLLAGALPAEVVLGPGDGVALEGAAGMQAMGDGWRFALAGADPHSKPVALPRPLDARGVAAISVTLERAGTGGEVEVYPLLDNGRGVSRDQRLAAPLRAGRHRYVFPLRGVCWMNGQLTALRLDPGPAPGPVTIAAIAVHDALPPAGADDVVAPMPADAVPRLGPAADTHPEAALIRWRLRPDHLGFAVLADLDGRAPVVAVQRRNPAPWPLTAGIAFASPVLRPLSPAIPPYVGADARRVRLALRSDDAGALAAATLVLTRTGAANERVALAGRALRAGAWNEVEAALAVPASPAQPLVNVGLELALPPGADATVQVADVEVEHGGGRCALLTTAMPRLCEGLERPLAQAPLRGLPERDTIAFGGYRLHEEAWFAGIPAMAAVMRGYFPEVDFVLAPVWTPPARLAALLPRLPEGVYFQFQKARLVPDYLHARGLMPRNAAGAMHPNLSNAVLATDPLIQAALRDEIDYAASLGVASFKQVDYVWPFQGGRWGYDAASVAAYREDLRGDDEGLLLLPGPAGEPAGLMRFWDYFAHYHGLRLAPADLGLAAWDDYQPVSERAAAQGDARAKRNLAVYLALFHYEWLRQAQRFGRWAKAHGGRHDFTLNPEDLGNGGDLVFITRLADAGYPYVEYFGGPAALAGAYHNLPLYVRTGEAAGKKMGLITEIGQTGHGQNYLGHEIGYLYAYELAALGLRNYHNEWAEADWATMSDPANRYHHHRLQAWMSQAFGFRQARREGTVRPPARVANVTLRSTVQYINSWIWGVNQAGSFAPLLAERQVDYEQCDPMELPAILARVDTVFFAPPVVRPGDGGRLAAWLAAGGRTLITHSAVPVSLDDGQANLAKGVEAVVYRGEEYSYADFLAPPRPEGAVLLPGLDGVRAGADGWWSLPAGAEALLADEQGRPLLSCLPLAGGSRVLYLHREPASFAGEGRDRLFAALDRALALPRLALPAEGSGEVMVHRFRAPGAEVVHLWNSAFLRAHGFKAGYGPHLLPDRGANRFDPGTQPNPYPAPGARCAAWVPVAAPGRYRVYAFLQDAEMVVEAGADRRIRLDLAEASAEQFHLAVDGPEAVGRIAALRRHREQIRPYCPHLKPGVP